MVTIARVDHVHDERGQLNKTADELNGRRAPTEQPTPAYTRRYYQLEATMLQTTATRSAASKRMPLMYAVVHTLK